MSTVPVARRPLSRNPFRRLGSGAGRRSGVAVLPDRVRTAIAAQEDRAEILIGWVQAGLLVTFAVLYALSPKPVNETAFQPVGVFLAVYGAFTGARLWLAHRRRLPNLLVDASIVVDMALLMGLIWSFHHQYDQPPSFYLKAPTLLYVFIFIALRALRFEPRFILASGIAAAVGWGALVFYAVKDDLTREMITRDYVEYLTANKILLGAEFDKMISIVTVAIILTVAVSRARALLIAAVRETQAADDLKRFFDPAVASTITGAAQVFTPGQGEVRHAAILMVDIRGFTRRAGDIPPEATIALLTQYQERVVPAIHGAGGTIDKFLGDGVMATFGAVEPSETGSADALRALEAVLAAGAEWQAALAAAGDPDPPRVNAAVACGPIVAGTVGWGDRLEFTVIGDAVNLAAKLEGANKGLATAGLAPQSTWDRAVAQGFVPSAGTQPLPAAAVPGVSKPLDLVGWPTPAPAE